MTNQPLVTSRQPIYALRLEGNCKLDDKFAMYREVLSNKIKDAVNFTYLEHLFRVSTDLAKSQATINKLKEPVKQKLVNLINAREEILQEALHALDTVVSIDDLQELSPKIMAITYRWKNNAFAKEEKLYGAGDSVPISYTLVYGKNLYILYTFNMCCIDGYEPYSGQAVIPLLTQNMIKNISKELYMKANDIAVQTEKKRKNSLKEAKNNLNYYEENKKQQDEDKDHEEHENHEEQDHDDSQEYEEHDINNPKSSDDETSESYEPPVKIITGQRTWERFQKKATERQKERDQCGPGDCLIS
jgi:hypothetical protein